MFDGTNYAKDGISSGELENKTHFSLWNTFTLSLRTCHSKCFYSETEFTFDKVNNVFAVHVY